MRFLTRLIAIIILVITLSPGRVIAVQQKIPARVKSENQIAISFAASAHHDLNWSAEILRSSEETLILISFLDQKTAPVVFNYVNEDGASMGASLCFELGRGQSQCREVSFNNYPRDLLLIHASMGNTNDLLVIDPLLIDREKNHLTGGDYYQSIKAAILFKVSALDLPIRYELIKSTSSVDNKFAAIKINYMQRAGDQGVNVSEAAAEREERTIIWSPDKGVWRDRSQNSAMVISTRVFFR